MNTSFKERRYRIQAKRNPNDRDWTDWTVSDDYDEATRQLDIIRSLGFCGKIVDKAGIDRVVKMLEEEYDKVQKLDCVKNPLAVALYAVWKKVDKEDKKRCKKKN